VAALFGCRQTTDLEEDQLRALNFDHLRNFSNYLSMQKREGEIDDDEFTFLMKYLSTCFTEKEIDFKIKRTFKDFL